MKKNSINVLYIDGVGPFGGASRSLYELVSHLIEQKKVNPHFIATKGSSINFYSQLTQNIIKTRGLFRFDHTKYSYYRGMRWLVLTREVFNIPFTLFSIIKAWYKWRDSIELIHCNEITEIVPSLLAKWIFKVPLVIHVRSIQCRNYKLIRTHLLHRILNKYVDKIIVIDNTVKKSLPDDLPIITIHNSFSVKYVSKPALDVELNIKQHLSFKVGFVGNLQVSKGIIELIKAASIIKSEKQSNIEFIFIGGKTHHHGILKKLLIKILGIEQDVSSKVDSMVKNLNCEDIVHFIGHKDDIHRYYPRFDVLAFPSHFDAPGRPVFEAAFYKVPCIVCVQNPEDDTVIDKITGICIPPFDARALADTILWFYNNPHKRIEMGEASQQLALNNFLPSKNSLKVFAIYSQFMKNS